MEAGRTIFFGRPREHSLPLEAWFDARGSSSNQRRDFVEPGFRRTGFKWTHPRPGRLLLCQHGARRIVRLENDERSQTVIVDRFEAHRLNNPNDLALHVPAPSISPIRLTASKDGTPFSKEIPWNGVYRVAQIVPSLSSPKIFLSNGLAFSPDEKTLYVGNSDAALPRVMAFEVRDDGLLGASRQFFECPFSSEVFGGHAMDLRWMWRDMSSRQRRVVSPFFRPTENI